MTTHDADAMITGPERIFYSDEACTIYHGDCREVLPLLFAEADAIVTDPPYNVGFGYDGYVDRLPEPEYAALLKDAFGLCSKLLKQDGALVWFWQGIRVFNGEARACLPDGFAIHHAAAWFKSEFAGDMWKGGHPAFAWEPIIWASRPGLAKYHGPKGGHGARDLLIGTHSRHDPLTGRHKCPKPLKVVRQVLSWVVPKGGLVIDPFMGSGTTLRAAKDLGARAIGIDIDERFCEDAAKRLGQEALSLGA